MYNLLLEAPQRKAAGRLVIYDQWRDRRLHGRYVNFLPDERPEALMKTDTRVLRWTQTESIWVALHRRDAVEFGIQFSKLKPLLEERTKAFNPNDPKAEDDAAVNRMLDEYVKYCASRLIAALDGSTGSQPTMPMLVLPPRTCVPRSPVAEQRAPVADAAPAEPVPTADAQAEAPAPPHNPEVAVPASAPEAPAAVPAPEPEAPAAADDIVAPPDMPPPSPAEHPQPPQNVHSSPPHVNPSPPSVHSSPLQDPETVVSAPAEQAEAAVVPADASSTSSTAATSPEVDGPTPSADAVSAPTEVLTTTEPSALATKADVNNLVQRLELVSSEMADMRTQIASLPSCAAIDKLLYLVNKHEIQIAGVKERSREGFAAVQNSIASLQANFSRSSQSVDLRLTDIAESLRALRTGDSRSVEHNTALNSEPPPP